MSESSSEMPSKLNFDRQGESLLAQIAIQEKNIHERLGSVCGSKFHPINLIFEDKKTGGRVYCGNLSAATSSNILQENNISNVIDCRARPDSTELPCIQRHNFPVENWVETVKQRRCSVLEYMRPTLDFLDTAVARGESTLVHCLAGAHRAGTASVAYLMHRLGMTRLEATDLAKSRRSVINPFGRLVTFLEVLQKDLRQRREANKNDKLGSFDGTGGDQVTSASSITMQGEDSSSKLTGYKFALHNDVAWKTHLQEKGYVVIAAALTAKETADAHRLLWDDIESLWPGTKPPAVTSAPAPESVEFTEIGAGAQCTGAAATARVAASNDESGEAAGKDTKEKTPILPTAAPPRLGSSPNWAAIKGLPSHGLVPQLCQSAGAWAVRGAPGVRRVFAKIWGCPEQSLITSMDCVIAWRPWGKNLNVDVEIRIADVCWIYTIYY